LARKISAEHELQCAERLITPARNIAITTAPAVLCEALKREGEAAFPMADKQRTRLVTAARGYAPGIVALVEYNHYGELYIIAEVHRPDDWRPVAGENVQMRILGDTGGIIAELLEAETREAAPAQGILAARTSV